VIMVTLYRYHAFKSSTERCSKGCKSGRIYEIGREKVEFINKYRSLYPSPRTLSVWGESI
jgi:hypothetical protein